MFEVSMLLGVLIAGTVLIVTGFVTGYMLVKFLMEFFRSKTIGNKNENQN